MNQERRRELFIIGKLAIAGVLIIALGLILTLAFYIGRRIIQTLDADGKPYPVSAWRQ